LRHLDTGWSVTGVADGGRGPGERGATERLFGVVTERISAAFACQQVDKDRHALLVEIRT
jgi:hypothetical protein